MLFISLSSIDLRFNLAVGSATVSNAICNSANFLDIICIYLSRYTVIYGYSLLLFDTPYPLSIDNIVVIIRLL